MSCDRRRSRPLRTRTRAALTAALVASLLPCSALGDADDDRVLPRGAVTVAGERITLDARALANSGIETVAATPITTSTEVHAFGRALDPLPLVEALHARATTRALATAARAEERRVARLHVDDQNASTRDLEAADAALQRAQNDAADAAARLAVGWGKATELDDATVDALVTHHATLVRIDLPSGVHLGRMPASATLEPVGASDTRLEARLLGAAPTTDATLQGDAYLALVENAAPRPGATFTVTLQGEAAPTGAVAVPESALVWLDAKPVVFVWVARGSFVRRAVTLGPEAAGVRQLSAGVTAGEQIVHVGAAQLVSAEVLASQPAE